MAHSSNLLSNESPNSASSALLTDEDFFTPKSSVSQDDDIDGGTPIMDDSAKSTANLIQLTEKCHEINASKNLNRLKTAGIGLYPNRFSELLKRNSEDSFVHFSTGTGRPSLVSTTSGSHQLGDHGYQQKQVSKHNGPSIPTNHPHHISSHPNQQHKTSTCLTQTTNSSMPGTSAFVGAGNDIPRPDSTGSISESVTTQSNPAAKKSYHPSISKSIQGDAESSHQPKAQQEPPDKHVLSTLFNGSVLIEIANATKFYHLSKKFNDQISTKLKGSHFLN